MTKIFDLVSSMVREAEIAADEDVFDPIIVDSMNATDTIIATYELALRRANDILDKKKQDVFNDVLTLNTRGQVERALTAYDKNFLVAQELSLDSTAELAQELIRVAQRYKLPLPQDWTDIASFTTEITKLPQKLGTNRKQIDL